jgi:hypothetical protein
VEIVAVKIVAVKIVAVKIVAVKIVAVKTGAAAPLRVEDVASPGAEGFEEDAVIVFSAPTRSCRSTTSSSTCSKSLSAKEAK